MAAEPHCFTKREAAPLIAWINERHAIYLRKAWQEDTPVWEWSNPADFCGVPDIDRAREGWLTADPIFQQYKFCNVFRELDRVTVWIREHIREPFADHEHLWFMLAIARFINWPPTLERLINSTRATWPNQDGFRPENMAAHMEALKAAGHKVETGAYMIRAESRREKPWYSWSKQRYVSEVALGGPWRDRHVIRDLLENRSYRPLQLVWEVFSGNRPPEAALGWVGWGGFMAGQVVADLRHTRYLCDAPDVGHWAPIGPGSSRGLNRLAGRPLNRLVKQEAGLAEMQRLQYIVNLNTAPHVPPMELMDIQNALCETDKYLRVRNGEGRPRALYRPGASNGREF